MRDLAHAAAAQAAQAAALHAVSKGVAGPDGGGSGGGGGGGRGGGLPGAGCVPRLGRAGGLVPGRGRGRPRKIKKDRKEQHEGDDQTAKHMQILKKLLDDPGSDPASGGKPKVGDFFFSFFFPYYFLC